MYYYKSKKVLITGASSGIGVSFARLLASFGAELVLTARRRDRLENLSRKLVSEHGIRVTVIPCDLSDSEGVRYLYKELINRDLEVDILINNAGFGFNGNFEKADPETYEQMIFLNIQAPVMLTRLLLPGMIQRNSGGVLHMASQAGFLPVPYFAIYAATKQFLINFTWSLRQELKNTEIRVTALCAGPVNTEFIDIAGVDKKNTFFRRPQSPDVVALKGLRGLTRNKGLAMSTPLLRMTYLLTKWLPVKWSLIGAELVMKK